MKKEFYLLLAIILGLAAAISSYIIFETRTGTVHSIYMTPETKVKENIFILLGRAKFYSSEKKLNSLDTEFVDRLLSDDETKQAFSTEKFSVVNGTIIDQTGVKYELRVIPPDVFLVTASDGQKFSLNLLDKAGAK